MSRASRNPYVRGRVKAAKSADKGRRFAEKRQGVKVKNANGGSAKGAGLRLKRSNESRQARANRTPSLGLPAKGVLLAKTPSTYVGRLSTVSDWHRQIGKVYREMRRHQIDPSLGTKLSYVANVGATLARFIEETMPKGIDIPPDYSRLSDKELQQLEALLTKAAGPRAPERLTQSTAGATYDN
jgi:hypothetical protein